MPIRISGMGSGLNIDELVESMMKPERVKVDKVSQQKILTEWRQQAYNDVNKDFANFIVESRKAFGLTDVLGSGLAINKSYQSLPWLKTASLDNANIGTVSSRADATLGDFKINVKSTAQNWSSASTGNISTGDKANVASQFGLVDGDNIKFTIATDKGSVTIDKTNLTGVTMDSIVSDINKADIGVMASYDAATDRFFLQTKNTGTNSTIKITDQSKLLDGTGFSFATGAASKLKLGYVDGNGNSVSVENATTYSGKNAVLDIGAALNIEKQTNDFTINGVNYSLKATGTANVSVKTDSKSVIDKVKAFIEKYNEMIGKMNAKIGEKYDRGYLPLTDDQKKDMSDTDIENWEKRAKTGLLSNDSTINRMLSTARTGLYENIEGVQGVFNNLDQIGITTEKYSSGSRGKLVLNETKLTEALQKNPDSVLEVLFKKADTSITDPAAQRKNTGGLTRLFDDLTSGMKDIITRAGTGQNADLYRNVSTTILADFLIKNSGISSLDKSVVDYKTKIDTMNRRLVDKENNYYKRFSAMERAMNQLNSQGSWLSQQLGGMQ